MANNLIYAQKSGIMLTIANTSEVDTQNFISFVCARIQSILTDNFTHTEFVGLQDFEENSKLQLKIDLNELMNEWLHEDIVKTS